MVHDKKGGSKLVVYCEEMDCDLTLWVRERYGHPVATVEEEEKGIPKIKREPPKKRTPEEIKEARRAGQLRAYETKRGKLVAQAREVKFIPEKCRQALSLLISKYRVEGAAERAGISTTIIYGLLRGYIPTRVMVERVIKGLTEAGEKEGIIRKAV